MTTPPDSSTDHLAIGAETMMVFPQANSLNVKL